MDENYISIEEYDKRIAIFNKKIEGFEKEVYDIKHIFLNTEFNSSLFLKVQNLKRDIVPREQRISSLEKKLGDFIFDHVNSCSYKDTQREELEKVKKWQDDMDDELAVEVVSIIDGNDKEKTLLEDMNTRIGKNSDGCKKDLARLNTLSVVIKVMFEKFEDMHDDSIHRDFFTGLLKQLDGGGEPSKTIDNIDIINDPPNVINKVIKEEQEEDLYEKHVKELKIYTSPYIKKEAEPELLNLVARQAEQKLIAEFLTDVSRLKNYFKIGELHTIIREIRDKWEAKRKE